jgi:hypothetical protein
MPIASARPIGQLRKPNPLWPTREAFYADLGLFILVVSGLYSVNVIGALPGCEVILLPMLPVLLVAKGGRAFQRQYLWFYILVAGWLLGTLIADAYNDIAFFNRAKGTSRVIFFALDFMALAVLINEKKRRIVVFSLSYAIVLLFGSFQFSRDFLLQWKFGVSQGSGVLAMLVSSYFFSKRRYGICFLISLTWAALNLYYGFRSQLAIHFVAAALTLPLIGQARILRSGIRADQSKFRVVLTIVLVAAAAYAANASIKYASKTGLFDESTQEKFEGQAGGDYGVLVGGRPETLVAIQAIRDSPIFGHGSFAEGERYMQMKQDIQYEHGYSDTDTPEDLGYVTIPTHSHLTLAWVEGGILGGICWIYILMLVLRSVLKLTLLRPDLAPFYSYALTGFLWDILYSPFGSVNRIWAAFYILMSYFILKSATQKELEIRQHKITLLAADRKVRIRLPGRIVPSRISRA